ncbi:aminotransferase class I/II-fold pyridoxal phosphate-dependent enzyme [Metabacillus herbersteinensis]|uniref:Aminotransferase class I/II-fold pyridoxal phosphate-dependent enzyme n=1 Tax=Metabacillus herbersteinensis TaxID=283816 RepID=A0ABV6GKM8_9BACI
MKTPLFNALLQHVEKNPISYHVPGHKNGEVFYKKAEALYKDILKIDVTELTGLDDLHQPKAAIEEAQLLTAALYDVQFSYFLVNGSTVGNLAMIMACCEENEPVLVQRNSHKSIINGLQLAGALPVFLSPVMDFEYNVPSYVDIDTVKEAIKRYPNANALILTNPNYYGLANSLKDIIKLAHNAGIPVLIDEAHGTHFILGAPFPTSAIEYGADVVVQSAHKTLPAMTMGSYLHVNSRLVDQEKITRYLSILQSSSPSYPIMASLDLARAYLEDCKETNKKEMILTSSSDLRNQLSLLNGIEVVNSKDSKIKTDPLKITVKSSQELTGFDLQTVFESNGIYGEMADVQNFLLVLPLKGNLMNPYKLTQIENLLSGFQQNGEPKDNEQKRRTLNLNNIEPLEESYSQLKKRSKAVVPINGCVGMFAAESIIPYPPGIPLFAVGEKITIEKMDRLQYLLRTETNFQGDQHLQAGNIAVYQ